MNIRQVFEIGFLQRWHTNPRLSRSGDSLHGHYGRVARSLILFWPDISAAAISYALNHDDGEFIIGDLTPEAKNLIDIRRVENQARASFWPLPVNLSALELRKVVFCDKLDAYFWAQYHAPEILKTAKWLEAKEWLLQEAADLEIKCLSLD